MNIVVLSPKNRGVGTTTVAYMLGVELNHRGEFVQVLDLNPERPSLMKMCQSIRKYAGQKFDGMTNLLQLIRTGTINAEDMSNCAVDIGVDVICANEDIGHNEASEIVSVTKNCQIGGRNLYTIIDLNVEDSNNEMFKAAIKSADVCVFVMTQDIETIENINQVKSLNDKSLRDHGIKTCYVINKFENCARGIKSIWEEMNVKDTKCWFKIRYNEHILQTKSLGLELQFAEALRTSNDTDVARVKADIVRLTNYVLTMHK